MKIHSTECSNATAQSFVSANFPGDKKWTLSERMNEITSETELNMFYVRFECYFCTKQRNAF